MRGWASGWIVWRLAEGDTPLVGRGVFGLVSEPLLPQGSVERNRLERGDQQQFLPGLEHANGLHDRGERFLAPRKFGTDIQDQRWITYKHCLSLRKQ